MIKKIITTICVSFLLLMFLVGVQTLKKHVSVNKLLNLASSITSQNGDLTVYNGEEASLLNETGRSCLSNAEEISPGRNNSGKALKLTPDQWHSSGYMVNCGGQDRLDFSSYSYIEFYIKGIPSQSDGNHDFNIVSYYGTSNTINLLSYTEGGVIDNNWRLVSIPLSALKTASYNLNTVDTIYFGSDSSNRVFYVDDITVRKQKTQVSVANPAPIAQAANESSVVRLYDGEQNSAPLLYTDRSCISYAREQAGSGKDSSKGLVLTPDAYHSPNFKVYCGGRSRADFSGYSAIEFYLKADSADSNTSMFNVVSYYGTSNSISIKKYIDGGVIDTNWRLVSIPISDLKTGSYTLNTVDDMYFGTDTQNRNLYIDNLLVTKTRSSINTTIVGGATTIPTRINGSNFSSTPPAVAQKPTVIYETQPNRVPVIPPVVKPVAPKDEVAVEDIIKTDTTGLTSNEIYDFDDVDMANHFGQWLYTESKDYISLNFTEKYNTDAATNLTNYTIKSADDTDFSTGLHPTQVGYRWRTLYAPTIRKTDLKIAYRIFLKLPSSLKNGKRYTIETQNLGVTSQPFTFTYNDATLNQNIKVNQVGYLPTGKKISYVGQYMGTAGPMPFTIYTFEVRNVATGGVALKGIPKLRNIDTNNTGQTVYEMDFSSLTTPGMYYISVPGVGISYQFRIGSDIYNEVLSNALRGAYQQRSGTSLTADFTRFTHGPSHMEDAYVMNSNPIPDWFRQRFDSQGDTNRKDASGKRFYYPTNLSGQFIKATKGHYDAGDYGKYVVNGSFFVGNILSAFEAFPDRLMKDDLHLPESGNGIPDLIDEVKWELDWLENMQDPEDGGVFCIVKPDGAIEYYENRTMDAPAASKRLMYAKDTTCTGAYAAALAKAAQSPLIKKSYPEAAKRYLEKAIKAWSFLSKNSGYLGWHHYGVKDEFNADKSMDERVWAAIELFGATGEKEYMNFFVANHNPEYERWGWNTLFESSGQADYACAFMKREGMDTSMKNRCAKEIIKAADSHVKDSDNRAYRLSMSDAPLNYRDFTYFFPQERIIQLLIANSITPNPTYTQTALYNWDYILGANPTSYSFVTGIGSKRFREAVSTQGVYDDIKAPIPGLPIGMGNNFGYLEVYGSRLAQMFPPNNAGSPAPNVSYPLLEQVYDGWNIGVEYTIPEIAENIVSAAYFATINDTRNTAPTAINITADKVSGPTPLMVNFRVTGTDGDGKTVRYFWDFDDETFSVRQNPTHTFQDPYKLYKVVVTITDNDGAEKYKEIDIRTSPATFDSTSDEYTTDANSLAIFRLNTSPLSDATGHSYTIQTSGNTKISNENTLWMKNPIGKSLVFNSVDDTAQVELPRKAIFPNSDSTLVAEAKIYVDSFLSLNTKSSNIFTLTQGDEKILGLYDAIYVDGAHVTAMNSYSAQKIILTSKDIASLMQQGKMQTGTWYNLKLVISGGKSEVYINNDRVASSDIAPDFSTSDASIYLKIGGYKGYMDEIRIRNAK